MAVSQALAPGGGACATSVLPGGGHAASVLPCRKGGHVAAAPPPPTHTYSRAGGWPAPGADCDLSAYAGARCGREGGSATLWSAARHQRPPEHAASTVLALTSRRAIPTQRLLSAALPNLTPCRPGRRDLLPAQLDGRAVRAAAAGRCTGLLPSVCRWQASAAHRQHACRAAHGLPCLEQLQLQSCLHDLSLLCCAGQRAWPVALLPHPTPAWMVAWHTKGGQWAPAPRSGSSTPGPVSSRCPQPCCCHPPIRAPCASLARRAERGGSGGGGSGGSSTLRANEQNA